MFFRPLREAAGSGYVAVVAWRLTFIMLLIDASPAPTPGNPAISPICLYSET